MGYNKANLLRVEEKIKKEFKPKAIVFPETKVGIKYLDLIKKRSYAPLTSYGSLPGLRFAIEQLDKARKPYVVALKPSISSQYLQIWTRWE